MVPAFLMAALTLMYSYRQQQNDLVRESVSVVRNLSRVIDSELGSAEVSLNVLSASPSLQTPDYVAFRGQAQEVLKRGLINNVALIDATGQQLVNTAVPYGQPLPKTALIDLVPRVLQTGKPLVSGLVMGAALKRPLISVMVPVISRETGTHTRVLSAVVLPAHFEKLLTGYGLPPDRISVIFDQTGTVVARSHELERFLGKPIAPGLSDGLKESQEGAIDLKTLEGVQVLSSFSRSAATGWGVAVGIPQDSLTRELRHGMALLLAVMLLLICLGVFGSWWMGGRIAGAIGKLIEPAFDISRGKSVTIPELNIREVNEVGRAMMLTSAVLETTSSSLRSSETRMRSILQSAMDAIITVDDRQVIVLFNAAAAGMFGCPPEHAVGQPLVRFIPERFHERHAAYIKRQRDQAAAADAYGVAGVAVGVRSGGEEFPVEVSYSSVREGDSVFHTLIIRDVTARVRAQEALERSNTDLQQFAYVASHDLKTPLRSIAGFVQLLEKNYASKLDAKAVDLVRRTAAAATRLEQITDDLLAYARVGSETKPFVPVDFQEVFAEVLQLLDAALNNVNAVVTAGPLPTVQGDKTQLVRLMLNLIGNGIKYCAGTPQVHVTALRHDGAWLFSVKDNGIGIDPKHYERVFEPFKRLHTQQEYAGTGIGLAICRRIVTGHKGRIWIESESGQGSAFCFTIPDIATEQGA
ncbi:MAG TPA: ATP-binding protein [Polaromonas sp.]|nr:ATP-binding protein [Polaromonas sp.]